MLLLVSLFLAPPVWAEEEVYLGDVGVAVDLPEGWTIPSWGDWYLTAVDDRKTTEVRVTYTPYQVEVSEDAGAAWAQHSADRLVEEGHSDVKVVSIDVAELERPLSEEETAIRRTAVIEMTYAYGGKQPAVLYQRSFAVEGATLHVASTGVKRNAGRARKGLEVWDDALDLTKPGLDLEFGTDLGTEAGFSTTLPSNFRAPVGPELNWLRDMASETLKETIDAETCLVGHKPRADGQTALLLQCQLVLYMALLNERSFEGVDLHDYRPYFFPGINVDPAMPVETGGDRLSLLYNLPPIDQHTAWMGVTQYDLGHVMTYAIGPTDEESLDGAVRAVLASMRFDGAEGAQHPVGLYQWLVYATTYHPTHPALVGSGAVMAIFLGFIVWLSRRGEQQPIED